MLFRSVIGVVIDQWLLTQYRSADYTVQAVDSVGTVEITKLLVMHENGTAYQQVYANLNNTMLPVYAPTLGSIVSVTNGDVVQLIYSAIAGSSTIKVNATYITL